MKRQALGLVIAAVVLVVIAAVVAVAVALRPHGHGHGNGNGNGNGHGHGHGSGNGNGGYPGGGIPLKVTNHCPADMVVRSTSQQGSLPGGTQKLPKGGEVKTSIPMPLVAGRLYFYPDNGQANLGDQGQSSYGWWEMTNDPKSGQLGGNLTYVDDIAIPYSYRLQGGDCGDNSQAVCTAPFASLDIAKNCPDPSLVQTNAGVTSCQSLRSHCLFASKPGDPLCDPSVPGSLAAQMQTQIKACSAAGVCTDAEKNATPTDVWACTGPFANDNPNCALLNRGLYTPDSGHSFSQRDKAYESDPTNFYQHPPYNIYAKWVHEPSVCPGMYAFSYDDSGGHGGYHSCKPTHVEVSLCEGDK